jgi:hypothetical protein
MGMGWIWMLFLQNRRRLTMLNDYSFHSLDTNLGIKLPIDSTADSGLATKIAMARLGQPLVAKLH